jgi:hypothetical protein
MEMGEVKEKMEEVKRIREDEEEREGAAVREREDISKKMEEKEEEMEEVMKK